MIESSSLFTENHFYLNKYCYHLHNLSLSIRTGVVPGPVGSEHYERYFECLSLRKPSLATLMLMGSAARRTRRERRRLKSGQVIGIADIWMLMASVEKSDFVTTKQQRNRCKMR